MTYRDIKIRKEYAQVMREVAVRMGVKVADVVSLWPRCRCGGLLIQVEEGAAACSNCKRGYALVERQL